MSRAAKIDAEFDALGDCDELNSHLGMAHWHLKQQQSQTSPNPTKELSQIESQLQLAMLEQLKDVQSRLFDIGSHIATPVNASEASLVERMAFAASHVTRLERWIDECEHGLPKLTHFILPSGGLAASQLHICRTVCRRAERRVLRLLAAKPGCCDPVVIRYLNRLSDLLFVFARRAAHSAGEVETQWIKA